ncbi:hypothetical protein GGX14DRAFT_393509 [Mycena pura]|uniref:Uncharacterized protein n=1 Tax=Mycena pura TaxID=153505 RepID=A0AAD6VH05_9AGAR|nr:hypothetical protein GGX14DRAFT_393509 [Mycena pura]
MSLNINQVFGVLYLRHPFFGLDRACDWISPGPFSAWMRLSTANDYQQAEDFANEILNKPMSSTATFESSFEAAGWDTDSDHLFMQTDESNWHSHDSYMDLDPELCPPGGAGFGLEFGPPGQPFDSSVDIPLAPNTNIPDPLSSRPPV